MKDLFKFCLKKRKDKKNTSTARSYNKIHCYLNWKIYYCLQKEAERTKILCKNVTNVRPQMAILNSD
mgnify:CR=1 FL=1